MHGLCKASQAEAWRRLHGDVPQEAANSSDEELSSTNELRRIRLNIWGGGQTTELYQDDACNNGDSRSHSDCCVGKDVAVAAAATAMSATAATLPVATASAGRWQRRNGQQALQTDNNDMRIIRRWHRK